MTDPQHEDTPDDIDLSGGPGLEPAELLHLQMGRSFLVGPHPDEDRIRLEWYHRLEDDALIGRIWFGPGAQGPPGHAHGGSIAAVLDEAMGSACWIGGHPVVAGEITTSFKQMLPLGKIYTAEACIDEIDGRKILPKARIVDDDGEVYAEGSGVFIQLDRSRFESLADAAGEEHP